MNTQTTNQTDAPPTYTEAMTDALIKAMVQVGIDFSEDGKTAYLDSAIITKAAASLIGFIVHTSSNVQTRRDARLFSEEVGKRVALSIAEFQAADAANAMGIGTIHIGTVQ